MANDSWRTAYPDHRYKNLDFYNFDHRPVSLNNGPLTPKPLSGPNKPFSFEHKWLLEDDYKETIQTLWNSIPKTKAFHGQLSSLASRLGKWANSRVGNLTKDNKAKNLWLNFCLEA